MANKYQVFFKYAAHYNTQSVEVVGDFNDWQPGSLHLEDEDGDNIWWGTLKLPSGVYKYKFLIDGKHYTVDPFNPLKEKDDGYENSILEVGEARLKEDFIHDEGNPDFYSNDVFYVRAKFNQKKYTASRLILVIDDFIKTINGFELFRDEIYTHVMFEVNCDFTAHDILYYFELDKLENGHDYFGVNGLVTSEWEVGNFEYHKPPGPTFETPEWVRHAIFYQIFPERFYNGNPNNDPSQTAPVTELPKFDTFYGGDLEGVEKKLGHLTELGINSIYFNPIFESPSTHKYDTDDYMKIDPHFGGEAAYNKLVKALKKNHIRFLLDGVFNHTGTGFWAFKDIKENQENSEYKDWYFVNKFPLIENNKPNYECWWNFPSLPKLNAENPEVEEYLLNVASHWIKTGASGWRLDVPNEIDHPFWKKFRKVVKDTDPEAYIVGEIWQNGMPWLQGDEFDSVMNYRFRDACIEFFALRKIHAEQFVKFIGNQIFEYPMQVNFSTFNLLSSHDTARFFTVAGTNLDKVRLAVAFQFTYIGTPSIYYGEEIGLEGKKDPDNRRFMNWEKRKWNKDLLSIYKKLIKIRKENTVLCNGNIRFFFYKNNSIGFERFNDNEKLYILINNSDDNLNIDITRYAGNGDFVDIYKKYPLKRKRAYTLYANDFVILKKVKERD